MEAFAEEAIQSSKLKSKCWLRYDNNTFILWQNGKEKLQEFFNHINYITSIPQVQRRRVEGNLQFLDVLVKNN